MICQTCQVAGDLNQSGDYRQAAFMHNLCEYKGGGCFCQHAVGEYHFR